MTPHFTTRHGTVLLVLLLSVLSACDRSDHQESGSSTEASPAGFPTSSLDEGTEPFYCTVQAIRTRIAAGEIDPRDLPDWADDTEVDGTPRIVDFTQPLDEDPSRLAGRLRQTLGEDAMATGAYVTACRATLDDAHLVRTQGDVGPQADPDSDSPSPAPSPADTTLGDDLGAYCYVQLLRSHINGDAQDGTSWLPDEADATPVNDGPRLIDFSEAPDLALDNYLLTEEIVDALVNHRALSRTEASDLRLEAAASIRTCATEATDQTVEKTEGAPGHTASHR